MKSSTLQSFFDHNDPLSLDNCDLEAIHRSGAVQKHVILLVAARETLRISHWSANAVELASLPDNQQSLHDCFLGDIFPHVTDEIRSLAADGGNQNVHIALGKPVLANGVDYDAIFCLVDDQVFIELLPAANMEPQALKAALRITQRATSNIIKASSFENAEQLTAEAIQQITGYEKVVVYKFLPDASGKVTAEARTSDIESYLGLHFPSTDIPKQARHLYTLLPFRWTGSTDDEIEPVLCEDGLAGGSIDLTWSIGRSVSTMHTAYLRNMELKATFTCALKDQDHLWGLVSCHSRQPVDLPFDVWGLARDIADTLMIKLRQERETQTAARIRQMRTIEANVAALLHDEGTIAEALIDNAQALMAFMEADGFAFQLDDTIHRVGKAPPQEFIRQLIKWTGTTTSSQDYFYSRSLHQTWQPAREHMDTCCGVLIQPAILHRACLLIWFRGPAATMVQWAGDPRTKKTVKRSDGLDVLQPRKSFERWVDDHHDQSLAWSSEDIGHAGEIFRQVLDIIAAQAHGLKQLTAQLNLSQSETREELAQFAYAAAHDLQNPINTITSALDLLKQTMGEELDPVAEKSMEFAMRSSDRLRNLASQMADFVALGKRDINPIAVPLDEVIADAQEMLGHAVEESHVTFDIKALPTVAGDRNLLTLLFINLLSNALKYKSPDRTPLIKVTSEIRGPFVHLAVEDNGMGIAPADAERIFKAFDRLHRADEIPGTGLGLAICKRIAELHRSTLALDSDYTGGARFTLDLRKEPWTDGALK